MALAQPMPTKMIFALDQSSTGIGWSLWISGQGEAPVSTGYTPLLNEDTDIRHYSAAKWLASTISKLKSEDEDIDLTIVMENPVLRLKSQTTGKAFSNAVEVTLAYKINCTLLGALKLIATKAKVPCTVVEVTAWRKTAGIKSKDRTKQINDAIDFARKTYGMTHVKESAESICIGYHYIQENKIEL